MKIECLIATLWSFTAVSAVKSSLHSLQSNSERSSISAETSCQRSDWDNHPVLCHLIDHDVEIFAVAAREWARRHSLLVDLQSAKTNDATADKDTATERRSLRERRPLSTETLPVVFAHGMGDSCFNEGMQYITNKTGNMLGVYATCIPTGDSQSDDTRNGYFLDMNSNVDIFAEKVAQDPNLASGFHAIGFSQGNNVIRGYIAKYNSPPVHTFLSVNGVNAGVGAVPYCRPKATDNALDVSLEEQREREMLGGWSMCDLLMEQASRSAYTDFAQEHSFQANYWRDPRPSAAKLYHEYGQLAVWNNEAGTVNETFKENWAKTQKFVWVMATNDGMVWPKEGEQWGQPDPQDPFNTILPREQAEWYVKDLFGLRTAEESGKNFYEQFEGDHLQFTEEDFERWVNQYLK